MSSAASTAPSISDVAPVVFVSYSYDDESHKNWVLSLAGGLRANGVDVLLDQWEVGPGGALNAFMERIRTASRVVVVCTPSYATKANEGRGGVGYEKIIITGELVRELSTVKFIPVVRRGDDKISVPMFLERRFFLDFTDDAKYPEML